MTSDLRTFRIGDATVSVINIGDIFLPLAKYMNVPPDRLETDPELQGLAEQTIFPIHNILIQLPDTTVLVDAGSYDAVADSEYQLGGYAPPPSLTEQLQRRGVETSAVEHVIITHRHWDHLNATIIDDGEGFAATFPNATHYIGELDFEHVTRTAPDPHPVERQTLQRLEAAGRLELVSGDRRIGEAIEILAAPGETVGHQIVRVRSWGEAIFFLGDMFHHPIELSHPAWMVSWADSESNRASRARITEAALADRALMVATHIRPVGRARRSPTGAAWEQFET